MKHVKIVILFCFFVLSALPAYADGEIRLNEIQIEPDQKVEIVNNSSETKDISGWFIDDSGGTTYFTIPANTLLYPHACLVFTSNFNLNKSSADTARLFNNAASPSSSDSQLIDSYSYSQSPGEGTSFVRMPNGTGDFTSQLESLEKNNDTGASCVIVSTPTPTIPEEPTPSPTQIQEEPTPTAQISNTPISNVYISEVMTYPAEGAFEWVELFNDNYFPVALDKWYIDDGENSGSAPKLISLVIPAKGYVAFDITTSMLNNSGDEVRLLDSDKNEKDSFFYESTERGKTWGKINMFSHSICVQQPTKGVVNDVCIEEETENVAAASTALTKTPAPKKSPTPTKTPILKKSTTPLKSQIKQSVDNLINPSYKGDVLSAENVFNAEATQNRPKHLIQTFSFLSMSYSSLTIFSILLKMKFGT